MDALIFDAFILFFHFSLKQFWLKLSGKVQIVNKKNV